MTAIRKLLEKAEKGANVVLLPRFSCYILRHTFATRLGEAGVNMKVIQDVLGHADISTTMNIYADATKELKQQEFASFSNYLNEQNLREGSEPDEKENMIIEVTTVGKQV